MNSRDCPADFQPTPGVIPAMKLETNRCGKDQETIETIIPARIEFNPISCTAHTPQSAAQTTTLTSISTAALSGYMPYRTPLQSIDS